LLRKQFEKQDEEEASIVFFFSSGSCSSEMSQKQKQAKNEKKGSGVTHCWDRGASAEAVAGSDNVLSRRA